MRKPGLGSFPLEFLDHFQKRLFRITELDHATKVNLAAKEVGMHKLASGEKRALLVN